MKKLSPLLLALGLGWFWFFTLRHLSLEWSVNTLYNYGWAVPALAIYLIWERMSSRPEARPPEGKGTLRWVIFSACIVLILPIMVVQEANQDWIFLSWLLTGMAVFMAIIMLCHLGGRPYVLHFGFPILFIFTAVPWPVGIENFILQKLMTINAWVSAELLTITGNPAIAQGNIILVNTEYVNVDDACSGIRSLQTAFMMSLFLGEFYRIQPVSRVLLVISSFTVSFVLNLIRTFILSYIGGTQGGDALLAWHDPLGYAVLGLTLFCLWAAAHLITKQEKKDGQNKDASKGKTTAPILDVILRNRPPTSVAVFFPVWMILATALTFAWYNSREKKLVDAVDWSVDWPTNMPDFAEEEFSEVTRTILKFNEGESASWSDYRGNYWTMYCLKWDAGRVSKNLASAHSPDICLPAAGYQLQSFVGLRTVDLGDFVIPFRVYIFKQGETGFFYTFHCIWDEKTLPGEDPGQTEPLTRTSRIEAVLKGKRNLGQRVLGISVQGPKNLEDALNELKINLKQTLDY